ncbi:efflux RND transporter periplasmic adaptor subunit [Thiorhodococcus mannitoliphagus]|uniref:Efflux RND transporter periplasmic adaptor subunit n=1 Tax=Thiorhodococcus mannitoliphagus TaxID=329406 RepID=A0A6P1E0L5_9GAMM|nr:efflux RND transporter periplasmic adaptor subunit [Thiorhodococcus mannitoliphagus]NEX23310.1 efflux RND transporter periplasmic adaptor subunit [Thiorhodococcus mannitoliphagus]
MSQEESQAEASVAERIGLKEPSSRRLRHWRRWLALIIVGLALLGVLFIAPSREDGPLFKTAEARRGDLRVEVTATGKLQPVTQVDVGTEVSGTILSVEVGFNDRVAQGQVMAKLDPDKSRAEERQSAAALALAEAQVDEAQATVSETGRKLGRTRDLIKKRLASPEELDTAEAAAERAVAALAVARAKVDQAQAKLDSDRRTLEKTVIRSPIDGIVLNRVVEPGQTVAASLQTPVLFTLAENLTQMELKVDVDEADVGQVEEGQTAVFTVDAYPSRTFPATITQVRFAPETVNGVVTFGALLAVDNADLSLRPGMTATADILVREESDVLLVPNAALRFMPPRQEGAKARPNLLSMLLPRRSRGTRQPSESTEKKPAGAVVWVLRDGVPASVDIETGFTDGARTQVVSGELEAGTEVLVGVEQGGRTP